MGVRRSELEAPARAARPTHRTPEPSLALRALLTALACANTGCQATPGPIFPDIRPPIVWPPPPDRPRIRYVGQLVGEASLGARPSGMAALRAALEGPPAQGAFSTPTAVALAGERVYVADLQLGAVHLLDLAARRYASITAAAGEPLESPIDVAVAEDALAVADSRRQAVLVFTLDGRELRSIGAGVLQRPAAVAWNPGARELWVLDSAAHACLIFSLAGEFLRRVGERGAGPLQFNYPAGLTYRAPFGAVVADSMNFRVQCLAPAGEPRLIFGQKGDAAGDFALPRDVAVDSEGHMYVLDNQFENVQIFDDAGRLLMAFGREGRGRGEFYLPSGITIDEQDRIWIADTYNRRVQVFQYLRAPEDQP